MLAFDLLICMFLWEQSWEDRRLETVGERSLKEVDIEQEHKGLNRNNEKKMSNKSGPGIHLLFKKNWQTRRTKCVTNSMWGCAYLSSLCLWERWLADQKWKYSFELCVFSKEKFINFTHQPQFHLPLVLPPSNSLQSLPQPINQPLLCKGNASHGGSQQAWNIKLRQDRDPSQCIKGDQGIQP